VVSIMSILWPLFSEFLPVLSSFFEESVCCGRLYIKAIKEATHEKIHSVVMYVVCGSNAGAG